MSVQSPARGRRPKGGVAPPSATLQRQDGGSFACLREVGDGEERIRIEDIRVKEPLQKLPRHLAWGRSRRRRRRAGGRTGVGVGDWIGAAAFKMYGNEASLVAAERR